MLLVEKPDGLGVKTVSLVVRVPVWWYIYASLTSPRWQQCEQGVPGRWPGWLCSYDFPCFFKATCVVDAFHGGELAADDALCCLHHPLEGFAISSGAAAEPGSDAAREDAFIGAPVEVG